MIQQYSDNKAEFYYNKTYTNKSKKDNKKAVSFLFNTLIKQDIDQNMLTEVNEDILNNDDNNNSIFNDEFFIYRPEKKKPFHIGQLGDDNLDNTSGLALDFTRNGMNSGLLTLQTETDGIFNIVSNLSNQPLNEKIFDKIQQKNKKNPIKGSYNFSTTDKSKGTTGDSQNILNINKLNNNSDKNTNFVIGSKHESYQLHELMNKKDETGNLVEYNNQNSNSNSNINMGKVSFNTGKYRNPSPITPILQSPMEGYLKSGSHFFGVKNVHEVIDASKSKIPSSSKHKLTIRSTPDTEDISSMNKQSMPTSVSQQKFSLASTTLKNLNGNNGNFTGNNNGTSGGSKIEFKQLKLKPSNSSGKFANLLYSSESSSNFKNNLQQNNIGSMVNLANNQNPSRTNSNPAIDSNKYSKIPTKQIRNIDILKYNEDMKSPANYQNNNLQDIRNYELVSKMKSEYKNEYFEDNNDNITPKPTLTVHLDKVFKQTKQPSYENIISSTTNKDKLKSEKISYNNMMMSNREEESLENTGKINKIKSERQFSSNNNYINNNIVINNNVNNQNTQNLQNNPNSKIINYLNSSKKITTGGSNETNRILSSLSNTKSTINNGSQLKIKYTTGLNEKTPTNQIINEGKIKLQSKYFHIEQKTLASTRGYNKSKETLQSNQNPLEIKTIKTPVNHNRIKSVDIYSNNYINSNSGNSNHNTNINSFLQKIATTRNLNGDKDKKINFSPQNYGKR